MPQPLGIAAFLPLCLLAAASPVRAAGTQLPAGGRPATMTAPASGGDADRTMADGMERMRGQMAAAPMSGNPDRDFVSMMMPHHDGAIDMAKVELRYGRDPALRRLARGIITAQAREIRQMQAWIAIHPAG